MKARFITAGVAGAALALGLSAAASASQQRPGTTAVTQVSQRLDSGGNGNWATDTFTRTLKVTGGGVVSSSHCGGNSPCQAWSAQLLDGANGGSQGSFTTIRGAFTPNQGAPFTGDHIRHQTFGSFSGTGGFSVFYTASLASPSALRVPTAVSGNAIGSPVWPTLEWPTGTVFYSLNEDSFAYQYRTTVSHQTWTDSGTNGDGQLPFDGNITG
jgi:hypothetical protein